MLFFRHSSSPYAAGTRPRSRRTERAAAWHRELFDLVQSRREFLLLVPLKLTLEMMRGNNGIVNKMEF
jgi:hypothetical protein